MISGRDGRADLAERLRETAEYLVDLVGAQGRLVRLELYGDARAVGTQLARLLAFAAPLLFGYGCLVAAGVVTLARVIGVVPALLVGAGAQLVVGAVGATRVLHALRRLRLLDRSRSAFARTAAIPRDD